MKLCKYKDIFGVPGQGVHSYRFLDTAIVDYVLTIALAAVVTKVTNVPFVITTILMFVLGIVLHSVFCVPTNATKYLGI